MPPLGNSLLLSILIGILGFILGALLGVLLGGRGKAEDEREESRPAAPQARPGEVRVWHEGALSRLMTEMDGAVFSNAKELSAEQRQRLVRLLRDWASWLEVAGGPRPQPVEPPRPAPVSAAWQPTPAARPVAPPPSLDGKPPAQASIVAQINDILQEMLESGSTKATGIRLAEDASRGVTVWVGLDHYNSIDSVADPEALALIRAAVAEWERRMEGKGV